MDLHAKPIDPRSHHASPSFPYLRVLLSLSTSSFGGLLSLGETPVQAYPIISDADLNQISTIDNIATENKPATPEGIESVVSSDSRSNTYEFDLDLGSTGEYSNQTIQKYDDGSEVHLRSSSILSELDGSGSAPVDSLDIDSTNIDFADARLQTFFHSEAIESDWVEWFDLVHAATAQDTSAELSQEWIADSSDDAVDDSTNKLEEYEIRADALISEPLIVQTIEPTEAPVLAAPEQPSVESFDRLTLNLQGVYLLEGNDSSARGRLLGSYLLTSNVLFGATLDLTTGDAFTNSPEDGFDVSELFVTIAPSTVPNLRFTVGMIDLTAYFDRNSFAKDAATHFFNSVFQTNPALASAGLGSRPGIMVGWDLTDRLNLRGAAFSSDRNLGDFTFDSAAAEVGLRLGNGIIRGTYVNSRDAGRQSGFREIFQFDRGNDTFGLLPGDREVSYGVNAEWFIPEVNLGLFARYGWYENQTLGQNGNTYSFGVNLLDLFFADDRLGLAYGRELSNDRLRRRRGDDVPDVFEAFYDVRLTPNLRAGVSLQGRDAWSETVLGFRVRADVDLARLWR